MLPRSLILWMSNWWEAIGFHDPTSITSEVQPTEDLLQHSRQNLDSWWTYYLVMYTKKIDRNKTKERKLTVNFVQASKGKKEFNASLGKTSKFKPFDKSNVPAKNSFFSKSNNLEVKTKNIEKIWCHHCKTKGHYRKDWEIFKDWFRAKGKTDVYVCEELNLIEILANSWI